MRLAGTMKVAAALALVLACLGCGARTADDCAAKTGDGICISNTNDGNTD